jgi:hypothetical protein
LQSQIAEDYKSAETRYTDAAAQQAMQEMQRSKQQEQTMQQIIQNPQLQAKFSETTGLPAEALQMFSPKELIGVLYNPKKVVMTPEMFQAMGIPFIPNTTVDEFKEKVRSSLVITAGIKCDIYKKRLIIVDESYTSCTCGRCGEINKRIKKSFLHNIYNKLLMILVSPPL